MKFTPFPSPFSVGDSVGLGVTGDIVGLEFKVTKFCRKEKTYAGVGDNVGLKLVSSTEPSNEQNTVKVPMETSEKLPVPSVLSEFPNCTIL